MIGNPHARVVRSRAANGNDLVVRIESPIKGVGLRTWRIESDVDLELLAAARPIINGDSNGADLPSDVHEALVDVGLLIPRRRRSASAKFECRMQADRAATIDARHLVVTPSVHFETSGGVPAAYAERGLFVDGLDLSGPTAWVEQPGTRLVFPYRVPVRWCGYLARLLGGRTSIAALPIDVRRAFHSAQIVMTAKQIRRLDETAVRLRTALRRQVRAQSHTGPMDLAFPPLQLRALQRHYEFLVRNGWFHPSCRQSPGRMFIHNEDASGFFHRQMSSVVSALMGSPWKPSYCFLARYRPGADLRRHVDREACGMTLSWQIDHTPKTSRANGWPLEIELPNGRRRPRVVASRLVDGEMVAFDGRKLVHFRNPLPQRHTVTCLFLHFVDERVDVC